MSVLRDLPIGGIRLPHRCLRCGAPPTKTFGVMAAHGVDFVFVAVASRVRLDVPVCDSCHTRRWAMFFGAVLAIVGLLLVFIIVFAILAKDSTLSIESTTAIITAVMFFAMWWTKTRLHRHLDAAVVGVAGITVLTKENKVRLAFRDEDLAQEIASMSTGPGRPVPSRIEIELG